MKNVLVTGGAGFIGANLCRNLIGREGLKVVVLDDLSGGFENNLPEGVQFIKGSINDIELIENIFTKFKFSHVYHLAAYAAEGLSHFIRRFNYTNNLIGSINLINASINYKVESFVFTSSIAVYGAGQNPMVETMIPMPEDPYGIAKYAVELDLENAHNMFGLKYIIFRPHNVYGPYQNIGDKYRNVIGIFMNQIMKEEPLSIFGDGEQQRAFSFIDDICNQIADSAFKEDCYGQVFNIGADEPYTLNQLAKQVLKVFGKKNYPINYTQERKEVKVAYSDHSKADKYFGKSEGTSLDSGLKKMYDWAIQSNPMASKRFEEIEIEENLPPIWKA